MSVLSTGGTTARTLAARAADVLDVRDYGAKCDDITDDGPAFNRAVAALRATAVNQPAHGTLSWAGCNALIKTTLNFTNIKSTAVTIDGRGGLLTGETAGQAVVDALGTENLRWHDVSIFGVGPGPAMPSIGIQIGRTSSNDPADSNHLEDVSVNGFYSFAPVYNFASETSEFSHLYVNNAYSGNPLGCFGLVLDGNNHWNIKSQYASETATPDTIGSFDNDVFNLPNITTTGGCTPIWMNQLNGHKFIGGYAANFIATAAGVAVPSYEVVLWNPAPALLNGQQVGANTVVDFDGFHMEPYPTDIFYVTGPNKAPVINGLRFTDTALQATNSIFKLDPAITSATLNDLDLQVAVFVNAGTQVFDNPALWQVAGRVRLGVPGHWNATAFQGTLLQGQNVQMAGSLLSGASVNSQGALVAPAFSTGLDAANGGINVGLGVGTGTPYLDFYGLSGQMRIIGSAAHTLNVMDQALGSVVLTLKAATASNGGNTALVNGAVQVAGSLSAASVIETVSQPPASSSAPCSAGQHAWDANYEYRCVAANQWRRLALSSF